jgi:diguanylate cyclase (GGDEF)-like protein
VTSRHFLQRRRLCRTAVLRDVASAILSCLRTTDVACRYGGEELAILLPDCTMALATGKAEQIRNRITELIGSSGFGLIRISYSGVLLLKGT